jgi:hypothetical protein
MKEHNADRRFHPNHATSDRVLAADPAYKKYHKSLAVLFHRNHTKGFKKTVTPKKKKKKTEKNMK